MKYTIMIMALGLMCHVNGQTINNGDFETWNELELFETVVGWETSNQDFDQPDNPSLSSSNDAVDGLSSALLETQGTGEDARFGYVLIGEFGDEGPASGFPFVGSVDGLKCQIKYDIATNDSLNIIMATFFEGEIVEMVITRLTGAQSKWTEYNLELSNVNEVDEVMLAFASSNAMSEYGIDGSWLMIDDLHLTLGDYEVGEVPNGSFEEWMTPVTNQVEGWSHNNGHGYEIIAQTTDANSGDFAVVLENFYDEEYEETVESILTNGTFTESGVVGGQEISSRPVSFSGYYKYEGVNDDIPFIYLQLLHSEDVVGTAVVSPSVSSDFMEFESVINYSTDDIPDHFIISATPGDESGSKLTMDELVLNGVVGIEDLDLKSINFQVSPNPFIDKLVVQLSDQDETNTIERMSIYDIRGKKIKVVSMAEYGNKNMTLDLFSLDSGMYFFVLETALGNYSETVIKN